MADSCDTGSGMGLRRCGAGWPCRSGAETAGATQLGAAGRVAGERACSRGRQRIGSDCPDVGRRGAARLRPRDRTAMDGDECSQLAIISPRILEPRLLPCGVRKHVSDLGPWRRAMTALDPCVTT
ncbi:hypothetical protein NDU88_007021 [Pleurodeles waltl]|uniref:Uncharacterized protein n=1 Tax=Pleurodeles waltl TaxID=8319 RepID=A0AAV7WEZ7_PLEWA|nr:hypothetical protein NDU88_007021 [Pleurodeles waltl]